VKPHRTAHVVDKHHASAVDLSSQSQPSLLTTFGLSGVIASAILPGNTTGVVSLFMWVSLLRLTSNLA
jgi:predicted Zn-dependent protease